MAVREMSPEQKEELKKQRQEYCKKNPDTEGCEDVEEELNIDAIAEVGQLTLLMSGLASSMCLVIVVVILMRKM